MSVSIGDKFGFLLIERESGNRLYGGRKTHFWWCLCLLCNREEEIPERKLLATPSGGRKIIDRCSVCRRGSCVVCVGEIERKTRGNTCCEECHKIKICNIQNKSYSKRSTEDPLFNKKRHLAVVEKMGKEPDYALQVRKTRRNANKRYMNKPENKEKMAEYQEKRYRENKAVINTQRQQLWDSLTIVEKEQIRERNRGYYRNYQRRYRQWLKDNPKEYQDFIERQREYRNEYNRQKEMQEFRDASHELQEKLNNNE